mmetsp:Transcript_12168/g.33757  ORF Transcript_12168/g.33757 Transcript_12168/m.33757 type:complete len:224 (+) Transcript_12168:308-979(+)
MTKISNSYGTNENKQEPLLSEAISRTSFLEHVTRLQKTNIKSWKDIVSCVKDSPCRNSIKRDKSPTSVVRNGDNDDATEATKNTDERHARFAVNEQNGKPWVMIKRIDLVDESLVDELWWTDDDMVNRNESDNNMASYVEHHYVGILQAAYASTRHDDKGSKSSKEGTKDKKTSQDVELDFDQLKKLGAARGLVRHLDQVLRNTHPRLTLLRLTTFLSSLVAL